MRILMAVEPTLRCPAGGQGADPVGQQQRWSVDGSCGLVVSVGHYVGVIPERTLSTGWLIPGALAFLAVSIAFAAVMLVWHGGTGGGVPAAGGPTAGGSVPAGPGGTPTPAGGAAASSSPGGAAPSATRPAGPVTGPIVVFGGLCLDVSDGATADGTPVQLYACNGTGAQVWRAQPDGTLLNPRSGRCLDDAGSGPPGTQLIIFACTGSANQRWTLP